METLPPEMVEKISQYLTLHDLVRCCTVCRDWRNIFNEDLHWRRHQDLLLEEHLRTTPCSVEPAFEPPEAKNSTLTPISDARLFFLKEKHLWNDWKQQKYEKEEILPLNNEIERSFLTNNFLVRWCSDSIEIWDVSVIPMIPLLKTDPSVDVGGIDYCAVVSNNTLLVYQIGCVKVFYVDLLEKNIELKYNVALDEGHSVSADGLVEESNIVIGNIYIHINSNKSFLEIIDVTNGKRLKKESLLVLGEKYESAEILGIKSSPTSDILIVLIHAPWETRSTKYHIYFYSLSELAFLPVPVETVSSRQLTYLAIHGDYIAIGNRCGIHIVNYRTSDTIHGRFCNERVWPHVFNYCFVFTVSADGDYDVDGWFGMFSLTDKKITKICKHRYIFETSLQIINNKFMKVVYEHKKVLGIWECSGKTLKRTDIPDVPNKYFCLINQAFTRGAKPRTSREPSFVYHYW